MTDVSANRMADIEAVAERFALGDVRAVAGVTDSVLNENYRVETSDGVWFARFVGQARQASRTRRVLEAECRAIRYAHSRGVPVAVPRATTAGESTTVVGGAIVTVSPFVAGRTATRGEITPTEARALGQAHGLTTSVLADYHDEVLEQRPTGGEAKWDRARAIAELSRVDDVIRYFPSPPEEHAAAQRALRVQLALLESDEPRPPSDFALMPVQIEHGDFHERNVILGDGGRVAAVVDWERVRVLPRAFQMVRALDFTGLLADGPFDQYVRGYCEHVQLHTGEGTMAVEQWWQAVIHNTWTFTEVFIRGNEPVRRFVPEIGPRLERLRDRGFRRHLAETIERHARANAASNGD